jgi:hypothetical protein
MSKVVKTSLQSISSEFKNFEEYKENYDILLKLPIFQKLIKKNRKLEKENKKLIALLFSEKKTRSSKKDVFIKIEKDFETDERKVIVTDKVKIKKEDVSTLEEVTISDSDDGLLECGIVEKPQNIVYEIQDDDGDVPCLQGSFIKEYVLDKNIDKKQNNESEKVKEEEEEEEEEEEVEVEEEEEEEAEEEEAEEDEAEEADEEEEEEAEEEEAEEEEEEEEEEEAEEEEAEEEEAEEEEEEVEAEEEEEEEEVEAEEEEEEEEVKEVLINGKTFYASNEIDSIIYDVDENGDISLEVGVFKNGKANFN